MTKILLILLFTSSLFSQKLWEIEVDPSDYLRDVVEIPNSDLLLFAYNTGKLEIRNSQDGSFVNQLIKKSNESGELRISSNGQLYHYQHHADTIEFRDILTNEAIFRISPEIEGLDSDPKYDSKYFARFEIFDNNSRIVGTISYLDDDDSRNSTYRFIIYNLITKEVEYNKMPYHENYEAIKKTYKSPDDKYYIEFALYHSRARMFNLETREYEFEFDGENKEEDKTKVGILESLKFINNLKVLVGINQIRSFPELNLLENINVYTEFGFYESPTAFRTICDNNLFCRVGERKENSQNQFYFFHILFDINSYQILFNSKEYQLNLDFSRMFMIKNCNNLIVSKDFNNRDGIIACYDYNTLDIETHQNNYNYFSKEDNNINFKSDEFIGQIVNIEIYNSAGSVVGTLYNGVISQQNYTFQIPELTNGTYYLQCQMPNQNLNFNFVVVR